MVCVLPINLNANRFTHFISKLLESFENYARKFWSTCNRRMKNLFVQMKNSGYVKNETYYQRRNISVCMCGKGAHLWQHWKFSAIQRKQNTIEEITVYTGTVALLRPFQALILIGSHTGKAVKCLLKICAIEFSL